MRKEIVDKQQVPAFVIFHDSTLKEMSERMPTILTAFSNISGVGKSKLELYGRRFVDSIKDYVVENNLQAGVESDVKLSSGYKHNSNLSAD